MVVVVVVVEMVEGSAAGSAGDESATGDENGESLSNLSE